MPKIILLASLLIIAFSSFYGLALLPYLKEKSLTDCLFTAQQVYKEKWMTTCLSLYGPEFLADPGEENLCVPMAAEYADPITQDYFIQIDACLTHYSKPPKQSLTI